MPSAKLIILTVLAFVYVVARIDLIPDFLPFLIGRIDDVLVLYLLYRKYRSESSIMHGEQSEAADGQDKTEGASGNARAERRKSPLVEPHEVLGVSRNASQEEIRKAYRNLTAQYHPDKVAHLGAELKSVAHAKTIEIQTAYSQLMKKG